jgi:hypothetical protein
MIDPGSAGDWLQASLLATALGGLAAATQRALRQEAAEQPAPQPAPAPTRASATVG